MTRIPLPDPAPPARSDSPPHVMEALHRLAALVESSDDAIYSTTLDGRILSWNAGAQRLFGYTAEEVAGRSLSLLVPPGRADEMPGILKRIAQGERIQHYETVRARKDGTLIDVSLTVSPINDAAGMLSGVSLIARDITERRRLESEILQISEREQQRIGQDLHDDLCQQLTGIALMCKALEQKLVVKSPAAAADVAQMAAFLNHAISQTRDLVRGLYPVILSEGGLASALQELVSQVEALTLMSCRFTCETPIPRLDPVIALHLYRIAQEALDNALKHGKATNVWIEVTVNHPTLTLTITNDGTGFPDVLEKRTGMGLRIMQYRADMLGASFQIHGCPEGGTMVVCTLPRVDAPQSVGASGSSMESLSNR